MKSAKLAESIILQAIDDIYDNKERTASIEFFTGKGFYHAARMAGMGYKHMLGVLEFVNQIVSSITPVSRVVAPVGLSATRRSIIAGAANAGKHRTRQ